MELTAQDPTTEEKYQNQQFQIMLTKRQALFLSRMLPLKYSLQPEGTKKGKKSLNKSSKSCKRSNLPSPHHTKKKLPDTSAGNCEALPLHNVKNQSVIHSKQKIPSQQYEETMPLRHLTAINKKSDQKVSASWMIDFLKEVNTYITLKSVYGDTFDRLKEHVEANAIKETDFHQTIMKILNDQKMKTTKKGLERLGRLRKVYSKYSKFNINLNHVQLSQFKNVTTDLSKTLKKPQANKTKVKPLVSNKVEVDKVKPQPSSRKRKGSQSSSSLGFDFDLSQYGNTKHTTPDNFGDTHFMDAAFISRNLRKIPNSDGLKILSKYGINALDLLKIKLLSKNDLQGLKHEVKSLKTKYSGLISDSEDDKKEYVESSFEIQDD